MHACMHEVASCTYTVGLRGPLCDDDVDVIPVAFAACDLQRHVEMSHPHKDSTRCEINGAMGNGGH
jgi:hypothetical protein